jgi:hypothetical protein
MSAGVFHLEMIWLSAREIPREALQIKNVV